MTINEFIAKENLDKENPFEGCNIIEKFGINEYTAVASAAEKIIFNEETNLYRALFREFAVRLSIMNVVLNIEMSNDEYELDDVFQAIMCSGLWQKFYKLVGEKVIPDFASIIKGINTYLDDEVEKNRAGTRKLVEEVANTLVALVESESFQKMLETIEVEEDKTPKEIEEG